MTRRGAATHHLQSHASATKISSVTFLVKNLPNLARLAHFLPPTASHCLVFLHVPSQLPALVFLPARPPDRRGPTPRRSALTPATDSGFAPNPHSGQRDERALLWRLHCHTMKRRTSCDHLPQPSLSLSVADPHHSTLKTLKLQCVLLKKASVSRSPAAPLPCSGLQQSRDQTTAS